MKPEYFPPKEDVILQNEAPTDFYILVTGAVVSAQLIYVISKTLLKYGQGFIVLKQENFLVNNLMKCGF